MNYYKLKDFKPLEINELINEFNNGNTIAKGCISVYEDSIGKPGDRIVELKIINSENNKLIFEFNHIEKIVITEPEYIVINSKVIGIQNCKSIKWFFNNLELKYIPENWGINTILIKGDHHFRVKENTESLLFYTW